MLFYNHKEGIFRMKTNEIHIRKYLEIDLKKDYENAHSTLFHLF